jgi:hypothetical protein
VKLKKVKKNVSLTLKEEHRLKVFEKRVLLMGRK